LASTPLPNPGGHALLDWADAADAGRRSTEEQLAADLRTAGFELLREDQELGGLARIALAKQA